ncbi:MAG TPA: hypothetical protein VHI51_22000 [Ktedonobacterales bacterium]|nr:hypothetical protein [Ktedonobacterales bacterium]
MKGQERILRERFAQVACQSCGADHLPEDMLVLAQRGSRWLVLLTCQRCKHRGIFVASFPHSTAPAEHLDTLNAMDDLDQIDDFEFDDLLHRLFASPATAPLQLSDASRSPQPFSDVPITTADVASMRRFLDGFNGDFHALFGPLDGPSSR